MWSLNAVVSCGSSNRWWWFRCCRIKVTRQIHGLGCFCAHEEASVSLHVFLICEVIILIWTRLNQTSYLQNYKIALLAGTVSGVNVSLIPPMPEGELFQKGVLVSPPFIREGTCPVSQWPSHSKVGGNLQKRQAQFSDRPCVSKQMAALQSRGSARGFFPPGSFSWPLSLHICSGGISWFSFWFRKTLCDGALGSIQSPELQCNAVTADLQAVCSEQFVGFGSGRWEIMWVGLRVLDKHHNFRKGELQTTLLVSISSMSIACAVWQRSFLLHLLEGVLLSNNNLNGSSWY